jgi:hypothetical protein
VRKHSRPPQQPDRPAAAASERPAIGGPKASASGSAAQALALQRAAGNRAAARFLARWTAHPDNEKKGVMLQDSAAAELLRFNPPLNK